VGGQPPERYVIPARDAEAASSHGARVELLDDRIAIVEVSGRDAWREFAQVVEPEWIAPVQADSRGQESYPTGELTVRFTSPPTEAQLRQISAELDLRIVRRNDYVDTQVVFAPAGHVRRERYLPTMNAELAARPFVARSWLSTQSRYTRSGE